MTALPKQWIRPLARAGYSARGLVYLIIGIFAVLAAIGSSEKTDTKGALDTLLNQPLGSVLLWCLVVGLIGYVVWRLIQAIFDTDGHGFDAKGIAVRAGLLASAFTYTTLALYATSQLGVYGGGGGGGSNPVADFLTGIIGSSYVAAILSAVFAVVACAHFWKAWKQKYTEHLQADRQEMRMIHPVAMAGLVARGLVLAVVAILFFYRFLSAGDETGHPGLKEALVFVQHLPFGPVLLAALGLGLVAFAAYSFIEARWRRINVEDA